MGKFSSSCLVKCFTSCRKKPKTDEKQQTQPQETATPTPPVENTRTNMSSDDGIQTFQEYVDRVTHQRENGSCKQKSRWFQRITCCRSSEKQPPEPSFWIEPAPGYMARTYSDN